MRGTSCNQKRCIFACDLRQLNINKRFITLTFLIKPNFKYFNRLYPFTYTHTIHAHGLNTFLSS